MDTVFIDTLKGVADLVDWITRQDTWLGDVQPPLYIDIEGERLSRYGSMSLLVVLVYPGDGLERPHIIDIHTLGSAAFSTAGRRGKSLKDILEAPDFLKVFFDVRNDSDALYSHYDIRLQGVRDVQLMETACRPTTDSRRFVRGLSSCVTDIMHEKQKTAWRLCKDNGESLWNPEKGGSYDVFNKRPLDDEILSYCVGDVQCLPKLFQKYKRGTNRWRDLVAEAAQNRVFESQRAEYQPRGVGRTLSPWTGEQNRLLDSWVEVNPRQHYFASDTNDDLNDFVDEEDWDEDANDYEDWTRAPWQGPPS